MKERQIALYDIDKTSYKGFLVGDLVNSQFENKIISTQTYDAVNNDIESYRDGKIDYETFAQQFLEHWVFGLKGKSIREISTQTEEFFRLEQRKIYPFVKPSINLLTPTHDTYFVTAGPQFGAEQVAKLSHATGFVSTIFQTDDGVFTGSMISLAYSRDKKTAILHLIENHDMKKSIALGDSRGDQEMLASVQYPICINPEDPKFREEAIRQGWTIALPEEVLGIIEDILQE